jgi:hypothetical protein
MGVRVRHITIALCTFALGALISAWPASAAGSASVSGLWSSTYTAQPADCGGFPQDDNNFCWTAGGDGNPVGGVELGVKFTSSQAMSITGVRVYRVSPATVTGHLWDGSGGSPLATGTFSGSATHSWQDLTFDQPVAIQPGHTYVASYHVEDGQYAVQHDFFATGADTVGPISALGSADSGGNGVYCYDNDPTDCAGFPANTYLDSNYWVTPLWGYDFTGFFQPVANATVVKAGSAVPVKFGLGGDQGLRILRAGYPRVTTMPCGDNAASGVGATTMTTAASSLKYDPTTKQYSYVWQTKSTWAGTCARFDLGLDDGSTHAFRLQFKS